MFRTPTNLSHASARRDVPSNAARLRRCLTRLAAPLAGLLFAAAAHAVPQVSSLVHSPDILPAGGTVTSTITIAETDSLPIGAPGASFTYTIPVDTVYMGTGTVPVGSCSSGVAVGAAGPGTLTCSGITLGANELRDFQVLLRTTVQGTLSVTAAISGGSSSETKIITVNQGADVSVAISAPATAPSGSTVPIVFTLTNNGPDTSSGSRLTYSVPTGLSVSGSGLPSGCSISGSLLTCNVPATPATTGSNTRTFTVNGVVTAGAGSTITHQPAVAPAGSIGDGVSTNNSATANTTVTAGYVLALAKSHDGGQLLVGQRFNFRLSPSFSGTAPTGVTLSDTLPANFTIQPFSAGGGWTCSVAGQTVSCTRTDIGGTGGANVALGDILIPVIASSAGTGVVNQATVSATGPIANSATGSVPADVAVSATDFRADKRRGWPQNNVPLGQAFDYQVGSTNLGSTRLLAGSTIQLVDDLPAGVQINSVTQRDGYTCTVTQGGTTVVPTPATPVPGPATVTCTRTLATDIDVDLSNGASARNGGYIIVNATIPALPSGGGQIVNRMCVNVALPASAPTLGTDPDANTGNDCVNLGTGVDDVATAADVKVLKRVVGIGDSAGNRQIAGQDVTWQIEVVNAGPSEAQNVVVTDSFAQVIGAGSVSQTPNGGTFAGTCALPANGGGFGQASLSNCTLSTLPVCRASTDPASALPLCPVIQVVAKHYGDGASATDHGFQINNTANALATTPADPDLANNNGSASAFLLARTDVTVTKSASPTLAPVGQVLTYTLTAVNRNVPQSLSRAYAVSLTDTLPANLMFIDAIPSGGGTCGTTPTTTSPTGATNNQLVCTWNSLNRNVQQTVTVRVRPLYALLGEPPPVTNNVVVKTETPELDMTNNAASASTSVSAPTYDLAVTKHDDADPVNVGDDVGYTITVSNNAASTAEGVRLVDTLPQALLSGEAAPTFVSASAPAGILITSPAVGTSGGQVTFTIPALGGKQSENGATGEPDTLQFRVVLRGVSRGTFQNNAKVDFVLAAQNAYDTKQANNAVAENTTFRFKADVQVVSKAAVSSGTATPLATVSSAQTFDWLVQLRNNGPDSAETTSFTDTLPAPLVLAGTPVFTVTGGSFTPAAPTCTGAAGSTAVSCAITSMPANGTATVRIPVRFSGAAPANGTVLTNRAHIVTTGSGDTNGGSDADSGNNFNDGSVTVQNSALSGRVYEDLNGSGVIDAGEPGIAGVTMQLSGTDSLGNAVTQTTTTDANGNWSFTVQAGTYSVVEIQPAGYLPGITRAGTVGGITRGTVPSAGAGVTNGPNGSNANRIDGIVLAQGEASIANNFGEVRAASLAGRVYQDADYNGSSAGDPSIAGVTVTLTGTDMFGNAVSQTTTTAAGTGNYAFNNLAPGNYVLTETQPAGFADGSDAAGTSGGTAGNDVVNGIALRSNANGTGYDFGEQLTRISVVVFSDVNNNARPDTGEAGIADVNLRLTGTDAAGNPVNIVAVPTGTVGGYEFRNVPPSGAGGYTITETQPSGYAPGQASSNGHPGTAQAGGNVITGVTVSGTTVPLTQGDYLFGELLPAGISGRVYYDRDGNGAQGAPATEPGIAGVTITLTGTDINQQPVSRTTTTDANGDYNFQGIGAGSYTVTETRPTGYGPGLTRAGTVAGTGSVRGTVPTTGSGVTNGPNGSTANVIQKIVLGAGVADASSTGNNFSAVKPASLSGYVYADVAPSNGTRDTGEPGIAGTTIRVTGTDFLGNPVDRTVQTAADGRYLVDALTPGTYQIDETQPAGVADGPESLGTVGGAARGTVNPGGTNDRFGGLALVSEDVGIDYNFGERGGQIAGWVYVDTNNDGVRQPTEVGIPGVTLTLTGRSASGLVVNATVVTDASGRYVFTGLLPADAAGYTIRETQPVTYADGLDAVGTLEGTASGTLGNDVIGAIAYRGGNGDNYNFGERGASLAGTVYNDANRNGTREPQDLPIPGVTITLTGTDAAGQPVTRTAVTDANGRYELPGLPLPGSGGYTVTETQPTGYDEGIAVPGTLGGTAQGPNQIRVNFTGLDAHGTGYDFNEHSNQPASLTGTVWFDQNHNRTRESGEGQGEGWTVELLRCADGGNACAETAATVLYTVTTSANGSYRFGDLVPGEYRVRFRAPDGRVVGGVWPTDASQNGASGPYPTPAASDPRFTIKVRVNAGANVQKQDLPYDPGGVVYDSVSGTPVPGAVVRLVGPPGFDPAQHLLDGRDTYTTGPNGYYDFFLLPGAPAGDYRLAITPPGAYLPSSMYPAAAGALGTQSCAAPANGPAPAQTNPCVVSPGAALVTGAGYYLMFKMPGGGGQHVVANNIPLDPSDATLIELRKTTSKLTVKKGELLPYRITARNTRGNPVPGVAVVDTLPPGFRYIQGSLTVRTMPGGVALPVVPQINGRQVVVPGQNFAPNETKEYLMVAGVGVGVGEGEFVNQVVALQGVGGRTLSNLATATVRVVPDALFDCTDVIGKVYDDKNANGYQDDGEPGLANVRIATVNGVLATTDAEGRYHIACAAIPKEGTGSNLVLKLDERTLPSGYRTTSENPAAERATRGKVLKINFGATVHRVVRLALQGAAFEDGNSALRAGFAGELDRTVSVLAEKTAVLRLAYKAAQGEPGSLGRQRTDAVKAAVLARWKQLGEQRAGRNEPPLFNLDIEVELVPATAASDEAKP
ncbi:conserved repeat domain-containing protein/fimbrial isopeptide formation D2 domain-containing protein [Variovorax sp. YR266]|uniref:SdrD B-like domain-containing protein n=1 Tax=Variovorax sp. YR266 TaxID=1884386 RepID=UPI00089CC950|nr:SdrD B-like domain-containing protein [Variovorax sp. YR266]SDZ67890.1 conserved repeat domain-containing protein/fimbrial isopeptide formation D2 domain-containing protein [Variovorax sp. YR266]